MGRFLAARSTSQLTAEHISPCRRLYFHAERFTLADLITGQAFVSGRRRLQRLRRPMERSEALERRRVCLPWNVTWTGSRTQSVSLRSRFAIEIFCGPGRPLQRNRFYENRSILGNCWIVP